METAKVSESGQITVPIEIRRQLGLHSGDEIVFYQDNNGDIVIEKAPISAIHKAQGAYSGVAKKIGVKNDRDVQKLVDEVRNARK